MKSQSTPSDPAPPIEAKKAATCRLRPTMDRWNQHAKECLDRLKAEDHPDEFFHALRDFLAERYRRMPGSERTLDPLDSSRRRADSCVIGIAVGIAR